MDRMNTLTYEYELFRIKHKKNIQDMKKNDLLHIVNHLWIMHKKFKIRI